MLRYQAKKTAAWIVALIGLMTATAGCGGKSNSVPTGGTGAPAGSVVQSAGVQNLPNGGIAITFTGQNIYYDYNPYNGVAVVLSAGPLPTSNPTFQINNQPYGSWLFLNGSRPGGSGSISVAQTNSPQYGQMQLYGSAQLDPGTTLSLQLTTGSDAFHYNIAAGTLTLSHQSFQRLFGGQVHPVLSLAIDVGVSGNTLTTGGILIYTSQDSSGYHGVFLPFF